MVSIVKSQPWQQKGGEPAWDIARLFPDQGCWDERDYLSLDTNQLVEFTDGFIEVLPMPTPAHQRMVLYLSDELRGFVRPAKLGEALIAPMRIRLRTGKFREPDLMLMLTEHAGRKGPEFWEGADLVMEVVSEDPESRNRDHSKKRLDYADSGIPEYWIIDPVDRTITVLTLHRGKYMEHGVFRAGQIATSSVVAGFVVKVDAVLAAANEG